MMGMTKVFKNMCSSQRGYMTVEASFLMPLVLLIVASMIVALIYVYEKEHVRANIAEAVYSVPFENKQKENVVEYLNEQDISQGVVIGSVDSNASKGSGKQVVLEAELHVKGDTNLKYQIDYCPVSKNLRRWQLYGDLTE